MAPIPSLTAPAPAEPEPCAAAAAPPELVPNSWRALASSAWQSSAALCLAAGCVVAGIGLALAPVPDVSVAIGRGLRLALALWGGWTALAVIVAMARDGSAAPGAVAPAPGAQWGGWPFPPDWQIVLGSAALLVAALQRSPARLVVNLIGYGVAAVFLIWIVRRYGGAQASARAVAVLAVFALVPTHVDWRTTPLTENARAESPFRWTVGWPGEAWVLRHELDLTALARAPQTLMIPLAVRYEGPAQVYLTLNGEALGPVAIVNGQSLQARVPERLVVGQTRLTVDLRQRPHDPMLRLVAQPWTAGATLGTRASSYYDGERWRSGTFGDVSGRPKPGMYVIRFGLDP